ncbi:hypothetical protein WR25_07033 [Diploscapter pachys]|uniref:Ig-like domain-containing protein n=1 Tax=Diploscapter pachys TaxID=2018661 RepID=A0A2A2JRP2_9BILA|nr:hypothetical protein WR25_07033 [Diploscapter pachys]
MGNLAVIIHGEELLNTELDSDRPLTHDLWCQSSKDGELQPIASARFVRVHDRKPFEAKIDDDGLKARLIFGQATADQAGKYRCEIKEESGANVFGNMFAYHHPTIFNNGSLSTKVSEDQKKIVIGDKVKFAEGEKAILLCPIIGYPEPDIMWWKDDIPIDETDAIKIHKKHLTIANFSEEHVGKYRCTGTNDFSLHVDGPAHTFEASYVQEAVIGGALGWILPLIIILIILLLVLIIIYSCAAYRRYKADNYNVEERE